MWAPDDLHDAETSNRGVSGSPQERALRARNVPVQFVLRISKRFGCQPIRASSPQGRAGIDGL
jgi:hypothetical protein